METNACGVNYLNSDSHLPPRKRLLAGLKRQNSDVISPVPSTPTSAGGEFHDRLNELLRARLSDPNLSNEEIAEASRSAATEAAKVAKAARANAEEKAAKAATAVAAAKRALDLVASFSEETPEKEKCLKKNKTKKHVPVEELYDKKKNKGKSSCRTDEELARNLHRVINSSPRILRNSSGSDMKNHKHKKLKVSTSPEKSSICSGVAVAEGSGSSTVTRNGEIDTEVPVKNINIITIDLKTSKSDKGGQLRLINEEGRRFVNTNQQSSEITEVEPLPSKEKPVESLDRLSRKRGRIKQKKLPLSICSFRDQTSPKADSKKPAFSIGPSGDSLMPVERTTMWKCKAFKAPPCVEQNKVMQS